MNGFSHPEEQEYPSDGRGSVSELDSEPNLTDQEFAQEFSALLSSNADTYSTQLELFPQEIVYASTWGIPDLVSPEPAPIKTNELAAWDLVMTDMKARDNFGYQKYGTRLQPNNGRDSLKDAYQESLDLAVYLRNEIFKRDGK